MEMMESGDKSPLHSFRILFLFLSLFLPSFQLINSSPHCTTNPGPTVLDTLEDKKKVLANLKPQAGWIRLMQTYLNSVNRPQ